MKSFAVGDVIRDSYMKRCGIVVFVHKTDEVKYVVDYGECWFGMYEHEMKPATEKQKAAFLEKYNNHG